MKVMINCAINVLKMIISIQYTFVTCNNCPHYLQGIFGTRDCTQSHSPVKNHAMIFVIFNVTAVISVTITTQTLSKTDEGIW